MVLGDDVLQLAQGGDPGHVGVVPRVAQEQRPPEHGRRGVQRHPRPLQMVDGHALDVVVDHADAQDDDDQGDDDVQPRLHFQL